MASGKNGDAQLAFHGRSRLVPRNWTVPFGSAIKVYVIVCDITYLLAILLGVVEVNELLHFPFYSHSVPHREAYLFFPWQTVGTTLSCD